MHQGISQGTAAPQDAHAVGALSVILMARAGCSLDPIELVIGVPYLIGTTSPSRGKTSPVIDTQMECSSMSRDWARLSLANTPFENLSISSTRDVFPREGSDRPLPMRYPDALLMAKPIFALDCCVFNDPEKVSVRAERGAAVKGLKALETSLFSTTQGAVMRSVVNVDEYGQIENAR